MSSNGRRDMHLTDGRSQCSVYQDIGGPIPGGCTTFDGLDNIDDSEGWRFADRYEIADVLTRWMGVAVSSTGVPSNGEDLCPTVSGDGRYVLVNPANPDS